MPKKTRHYIGRYAPSPTGRLHLGNLRTALLAWLHARLNDGELLLRFDDLDTPRLAKGSDEQIKADLLSLGLDWDGQPYYQSKQLADYEAALAALSKAQQSYECYCSRKDIQQAVSAPHGKTAVYPGSCRQLSVFERKEKALQKKPAIRMRVDEVVIEFEDGIAGVQAQALALECGDFVIKRADGLFAYQLAVVVDDINQGITDVVRGADLLDSSARQLYLFEWFGAKKPTFWHMPLLNDEQGERLAKRDGSDSLEQWLAVGKTPEQLIAEFANQLNLLPEQTDFISANELLSSLSLEQFEERLRLLL